MQPTAYKWAWPALALAYVLGLFMVTIMDVDSAQYASISQEMLQSGEWLQVHHKGKAYLDKPPLLFWSSALFYAILGVSQWAFRLPSLLSSVMGFWATYQLGKELYNKQTGQLAALILASTQAWLMFNHDVRTDTLISNFSILAIWQLVKYVNGAQLKHLFWGFVAVGFAMMAKGPLGAVVPGAAIGCYLLGQKNWKMLFRWQWLLGAPIVLLVLAPMLYGLYLQFPDWEGIYFFFWKQSFGRITGENEWANDSGKFFFVHTFLWSFLPWSALAVWAMLRRLQEFWQGEKVELLTLGGFVLPFIALSFSRYKLPHYIFPMYGMMAVLVAHQLMNLAKSSKSWVWPLALGQSIVLHTAALAFLALLMGWAFPGAPIWLLALLILAALASFIPYFKFKQERPMQLVLPAVFAMAIVNVGMNAYVYQKLLPYQSGSEAAHYLVQEGLAEQNVGVYDFSQHAFDFYLGKVAKVFDSPKDIETTAGQAEWIILIRGKSLAELDKAGIRYEKIKHFDHFHVTRLTAKFLNPASRAEQLQDVYLIKVTGVVG